MRFQSSLQSIRANSSLLNPAISSPACSATLKFSVNRSLWILVRDVSTCSHSFITCGLAFLYALQFIEDACSENVYRRVRPIISPQRHHFGFDTFWNRLERRLTSRQYYFKCALKSEQKLWWYGQKITNFGSFVSFSFRSGRPNNDGWVIGGLWRKISEEQGSHGIMKRQQETTSQPAGNHGTDTQWSELVTAPLDETAGKWLPGLVTVTLLFVALCHTN